MLSFFNAVQFINKLHYVSLCKCIVYVNTYLYILDPEGDNIVTNFRVTHRTSTSINLAWDPPRQHNTNNYFVSRACQILFDQLWL